MWHDSKMVANYIPGVMGEGTMVFWPLVVGFGDLLIVG
jgi:hypothetical protein